MLLILFSLFSSDVINCYNETNLIENFNESSLLNQYRHNFLEVQAFIKDVEHKFHTNRTLKKGENNTFRLTKHKEVHGPLETSPMMGRLELNTAETRFIPLLRSRPIFPGTITPYTTELNSQHLKWDKIFPGSTVHTKGNGFRLRFRPLIPGIPSVTPKPSEMPKILPEPDCKLLNQGCPTSPRYFLWDTVRSSTGRIASTLPSINIEVMNLWLQEITTYSPIEEWMKTWTSAYKEHTTRRIPEVARTPYKAKTPARKKKPRNCTRKRPRHIKRLGLISLPDKPLNAKDFDHSTAQFIEDESGIPLGTVLKKNADIKTTVVGEKPPYVNIPVTVKVIEDKNGISLSTTLKKNADIRTTVVGEKPDYVNIPITVKVIEDKNGISFSTALEKNVDIRTTVVGERPDDGNVLVTGTTAGYTLQREQDSNSQSKSSDETRRFHSKVRSRKQYHRSYKRNRKRQRYRHHNTMSSEDTYREYDQGVGYPKIIGMKKTIEDRKKFSIDNTNRLFKRRNQKTDMLSRLVKNPSDSEQEEEAVDSSHEMSQVHHDEPEYGIRIKHIRRRYESRRRAKKEKLYNELKERLKAAESRKKVKQMMLKADLLRKIVEGSSYSDEEESLKKNLIQALKYGNRT